MNTNAHKTTGQATIACFALLALALPNEIHAQFSGNNQTNIISGVTSNWPGDYYVGSNYVFDALFILNSGVLSNGAGVIGNAVGANSNVAIVSGSGSAWRNSSFLRVGQSGVANNLVISNGGTVFNGSFGPLGGSVGFTASASNNSVLVTDSGSIWGNSNSLAVGDSGAGNTMVISNGGKVVVTGEAGPSQGSFIGRNASARNNSVLVTGSGSVWSNTWNNPTEFYIGYSGAGNKLVISDGGAVVK